jgi:CRISPR-associated exonuclease Cas4
MADNEEDDYLMLSGIQHFQFCKRQWAFIHIEQQWEENVRTVEGQHLHRNADQPFAREKRGDKLIVRAMPVKSKNLRITGICDVVEFIRDDRGVEIHNAEGKYIAYPVEYKRGKPKKNDEDILQLAAQAICLEEMLLCDIDLGYLFYNEIKHRVEVRLTDDLKDKVRLIVAEMQDYYRRRHTPKVPTGSFCKSCSLQNICLPELMNKRTVTSYVEGKIRE